MRAHCARTRDGNAALNCVTEQFFDEAMEAAKEADERWDAARSRGENVPLLLGIPFSVKDQFHQRGADSTCGLAAKCEQPQATDGLLVELLRDAGAIPFVRSNVPQCLMLPESKNNIWGSSSNPHDVTRTPGGSSGGEGGLIGSMSSPIGVGTDIGGCVEGERRGG